MSSEFIAFYARSQPQATAIEHLGRHLSYLEVSTIVARMVKALALPAVLSAQLVGVANDDPVIELMLLIAFEALGIATLPFVQPTDPNILLALRHCDVIVSEHAVPAHGGNHIPIDQAWIKRVLSASVSPAYLVSRGDGMQMISVFTTSGSSGPAKAVVFSRTAGEARVRSRLLQYGLEASSRLVIGMPPSTSSSYYVAQAAFRVGASVAIFDHADPTREIERATHLIMLPIHLRLLAERMQMTPRTGPRMKVFVVGATLSSQVRELAEKALNAHVIEAYGTVETGWIACIAPNGTGDILQGVDVDVVDDADQSVPLGEIGELRVRNAEMGSGYLDPPQGRRAFKDGWYYTGDSGRMLSLRQMELLGRRDHLMNFGGIKISPEMIEDTLASLDLADDVAACAMADAQGIDKLVIVCVAPRLARAALGLRIKRALGENLGAVTLMTMSSIPRTSNGKIQRAELKRQVSLKPG